MVFRSCAAKRVRTSSKAAPTHAIKPAGGSMMTAGQGTATMASTIKRVRFSIPARGPPGRDFPSLPRLVLFTSSTAQLNLPCSACRTKGKRLSGESTFLRQRISVRSYTWARRIRSTFVAKNGGWQISDLTRNWWLLVVRGAKQEFYSCAGFRQSERPVPNERRHETRPRPLDRRFARLDPG
jgi:hypothetical protein